MAPQQVFGWPISIDNEDAYEYALNTDPPNPNPGGDDTVITDEAILAGVQLYWPETWPPAPTTPPEA